MEDFHENNQEYDQDSNHNLFVNFIMGIYVKIWLKKKGQSSPVTGLEWPRGFQEVKVPSFHDNGTGCW